jgi:hypothetical protein
LFADTCFHYDIIVSRVIQADTQILNQFNLQNEPLFALTPGPRHGGHAISLLTAVEAGWQMPGLPNLRILFDISGF